MKEALIPIQVLGPALEGGSWQAILDTFLAANVDSNNVLGLTEFN